MSNKDSSSGAIAIRPVSNGTDGPRVLGTIAVIVLVLTAGVAAFTQVWNYDVFWHLAAGEWMLQHGEVIDTDPFSIEPEPQWVNVHWLFQLVIALLHGAGGFPLLTVMKSVLAATVLLIFAMSLRRQVPPAWLILTGLATLIVMFGRLRVRPEAFTLLFLMLTIVLMDSVRRGASPRRLWWLVPVMILWVNMHGLYILGVGLIWSAMLGAVIDRKLGRDVTGNLLTARALAPLLLATVAVLLTPWPFEAAAHPFLLWNRISGQERFYTDVVSELKPTWRALSSHWEAGLLAGLTAMVMGLQWRKVTIGQVLWLAAFVVLALMARRNVGLIAPTCGFLLALHGGASLRRIAE